MNIPEDSRFIPPAHLPGGATLRLADASDADYAAIAQIQSAHWPTFEATPEEIRNEDARSPEGSKLTRWLVEVDGRPVMRLCIEDAHWMKSPEVVAVSIHRLPEFAETELERAALEWLLEEALRRPHRTLRCFVNTADTAINETYRRYGFEIDMTQNFSRIDVSTFDPGHFDELQHSLEAEGIRFRSVADFEAEGYDWIRDAYELDSVLLQDVPPIGEILQMPFDSWSSFVLERIEGAEAGTIYALDGDRMIGMTNLAPSKVDPTRFVTGLTGVLREYRRRGIATALKARALAFAQSRGCRELFADNASTNPMYGLNLSLGFEDFFTAQVMMRTSQPPPE